MIRSFCSADQLRRRSTVEIISDDMCLTVLKHVNKDSMIHLIPPRSARRQCHSPERTLTSKDGVYYVRKKVPPKARSGCIDSTRGASAKSVLAQEVSAH